MLDEESGVPGGEESTCKGPSSSSFTSDGVCSGAGLKIKTKKEKMKVSGFYLIKRTPLDRQSSFLTGFFVLCSSSCALQNSCSKEVASSLNRPTSSQFFRKRVGVGVWSVGWGVSIKGQKYLLQTYTIINYSSIKRSENLLFPQFSLI